MKECNIVQDLFLSYLDDVLSVDSKELVERHLKECDKCKEILEQMQKDIATEKKEQEREIDYLKRIKRKARIKAIIIAFVIIIVIAVGIYLSKVSVFQKMENKYDEYIKSENFYVEKREPSFDNEVSIVKIWYREGSYKRVWGVYSENGFEEIEQEYGKINSDQTIKIDERDKRIVSSTTLFDIQKENLLLGFETVVQPLKMKSFMKFANPFWFQIRTETFGSNRPYYVLETEGWEKWFDKETLLPIKEINKEGQKRFFTGTDIVKGIMDNTSEYQYEFDNVSIEDVKLPDLNNYIEQGYIEEEYNIKEQVINEREKNMGL